MRACSFSRTSGRACACCVAIWPAASRTCSMLATNLRRSGVATRRSWPGARKPPSPCSSSASRTRPAGGGRAELARTWGAPRRSARPCERRDWLKGARAPALLEEAVEVLTNSPAKLEHAKARTELGRHFGVPAAPRRASSCDARSSWQRSAAPAPRRARRDRASRHRGAAPARCPERCQIAHAERARVAQMAAEGPRTARSRKRSSSPLKTVEVHLSMPYRKLGIRSRSCSRRLAQPSRG